MEKILVYDSNIKIFDAFRSCVIERELKDLEVDLVLRFRDLLNIIGDKQYVAIVVNLEKEQEGEVSNTELIHIIKKLNPTLPIVVTTENRSFENERNTRIQGVFFYMIEPFNSIEIHAVIDEIINKKVERIT